MKHTLSSIVKLYGKVNVFSVSFFLNLNLLNLLLFLLYYGINSELSRATYASSDDQKVMTFEVLGV